jgi:hypothetical protein
MKAAAESQIDLKWYLYRIQTHRHFEISVLDTKHTMLDDEKSGVTLTRSIKNSLLLDRNNISHM